MRFGPRGPVELHHFGYGVWHFVFMFAFFALVVLLAVWLVMSIRRGQMLPAGHAPGQHLALPVAEDAALREARMRYARGEMTREEFLQTSGDLGGPVTTPGS